MRRSFTPSSTSAARRSRPSLEALEARWCPSAAGIVQHGSTLLIQGDGSNDTITVSDNGQGGVTASITLVKGTQTKTATGITDIKIDAGGGNDTITYGLTGSLSQQEKLMLCLDQGSSQATLDYSQGLTDATLAIAIGGGTGSNQLTTRFGALTNSRLNLTECLASGSATSHVSFGGLLSGSDATVLISSGTGNDQVFAQLGSETNSNLQFLAHLGSGANSFDLDESGSLQNAVAHFDIDASAGGNTITFNTHEVSVDTTSRLNLETCTGAGNDTITTSYSGLMNGELDVNLNGGAGDNEITMNLKLDPGSTGRVHAHEYGDDGDDAMIFNVYTGGASTLSLLDAVLYTGSGNDTLTTTPNVKVVK